MRKARYLIAPLLLSLRRATEGVAFPIRAAHVHPDDAALG
jgi:hypothetical protein